MREGDEGLNTTGGGERGESASEGSLHDGLRWMGG